MAEYDIDAIEAHVAQVAEQAWSFRTGRYLVEMGQASRLKAYAAGLAMGLNESVDPEDKYAEHVEMDAFDTSDSYDTSFNEFAVRAAGELAQLARIRTAQTHRAFFFEGIVDALSDWIGYVYWVKNHDREFFDCIKKTKRSAEILYTHLEKLRRHLDQPEHAESQASMRLMPSVEVLPLPQRGSFCPESERKTICA